MKLSERELNDPLWMKLKSHYEAHLIQLRASNDNEKTDIETARLRGRIAQVKAFLAMGTPMPEIDNE